MRAWIALPLLLLVAAPAAAFEMCLVDSPNDRNATVDCDPIAPTLWDNAFIGYAESGAPCQSGFCPGSQAYQWTLSRSGTDPYLNTGEIPDPIGEVYLWMACNQVGEPGGWAAAEFSVEITGGQLIGFTPRNGVLNAGTVIDPLLAVGGCPDGPFLAGVFIVFTGAVSTESETWAGVKSLWR